MTLNTPASANKFKVWLGCLLIGPTLLGIGYLIRLVTSRLQPFVDDTIIGQLAIYGLLMLGVGVTLQWRGWRSESAGPNGEIKFSSPMLIDLTKWLGYILIGVSMIFIFSEPTDETGHILFESWLISLNAIGVGYITYKIRKDLNDKMIIADDFISIDKAASDGSTIIKRSDLFRITKFTKTGRRRRHYLKFHYHLNNGAEKTEFNFTFEPAEALNINRSRIENALISKGYEIQEE